MLEALVVCLMVAVVLGVAKSSCQAVGFAFFALVKVNALFCCGRAGCSATSCIRAGCSGASWGDSNGIC